MDAKLRLCLLVIVLGSITLLQGAQVRNQNPKEKSVKAKNESLLADDRGSKLLNCTFLATVWAN